MRSELEGQTYEVNTMCGKVDAFKVAEDLLVAQQHDRRGPAALLGRAAFTILALIGHADNAQQPGLTCKLEGS